MAKTRSVLIPGARTLEMVGGRGCYRCRQCQFVAPRDAAVCMHCLTPWRRTLLRASKRVNLSPETKLRIAQRFLDAALDRAAEAMKRVTQLRTRVRLLTAAASKTPAERQAAAAKGAETRRTRQRVRGIKVRS